MAVDAHDIHLRDHLEERRTLPVESVTLEAALPQLAIAAIGSALVLLPVVLVMDIHESKERLLQRSVDLYVAAAVDCSNHGLVEAVAPVVIAEWMQQEAVAEMALSCRETYCLSVFSSYLG